MIYQFRREIVITSILFFKIHSKFSKVMVADRLDKLVIQGYILKKTCLLHKGFYAG